MRILRLVREDRFAVDLHPLVTVVAGTDELQREALRTAFAGAGRGRTAGMEGLVEAHGLVMDLDDRSLALLDMDDVSVDNVVGDADLPGAGQDGVSRQLKAVERRLAAAASDTERLRAALAATEDEVAGAAGEVESLIERSRARRDATEEHEARLATLTEDLAEAELADEQMRDERDLVEAERARLVAEQERLADALAEVEAERDAARKEGDRLAARIEALDAGRDGSADEELAAAVAAQRAVVDDLDRRRAELGAAVAADEAAAVEAARQARAEAEQRAAEEAERSAAEAEARRIEADRLRTAVEDVEARIAVLGEELSAIDDRLHVLVAFDRAAVRDALLEVARQREDPAMVPSARALALAADLEELDQRIARNERDAVDADELRDAQIAVEVAQEELAALEAEAARARSTTIVDGEAAEELEDVHRRLVAAQEKSGSRFSRGSGRQVEDLREQEDELLARLGYGSFTDYLTRTPLVPFEHLQEEGDADLERRFQARSRLEEAQRELADLEERVETELETAKLVERRRQLRDEARELVDAALPDTELVDALQRVEEPADLGDAAMRQLRQALAGVGLAVDRTSVRDEHLVPLAEAWLDEAAGAQRERMALDERRAQVVAELEALNSPAEPSEPDANAAVADDDEASEDGAGTAGVAVIDGSDDGPAGAGEGAEGDDVGGEEAGDGPDPFLAQVVPLADRLAAVEPEWERELAAAADAVELARQRSERQGDLARERAELDARLAEVAAAFRTAEATVERLRDEQRSAAERLVAAEAEVEQIAGRLTEIADRVERCRAAVEEERALVAESTATEEEVAGAEARLSDARARERELRAELDEARRLHDELAEEATALRAATEDSAGRETPVEEIEWFLLARLGAMRNVAFGGSVPLLVDRALDGLDAKAAGRVLDRLERMSGAVQVVHISDSQAVVQWAEKLGPQRAAVVTPVAPGELAQVFST